MDFFKMQMLSNTTRQKLNWTVPSRYECFKKAQRYIITFKNNIKWVWHSLIKADMMFYTFCSQNIQCLPFDHHWSCPFNEISHFWKKNARLPFTYQTHDLIVVIQTETFQRQRLSANKQAMGRKNTERQREKGKNSSVVHLADDILCTLSVISFSSARMDRISPLSLWDDCFTEVPGDTFFLCLSRFSSLSSSQWLLFSWNFMN